MAEVHPDVELQPVAAEDSDEFLYEEVEVMRYKFFC